MSYYRKLQSACQRGANNLHDANNLLAECYSAIGELVKRGSHADSVLIEDLRKDAESWRALNANS